ncbi:MAG TPA: DUF6265 family protein [Candidatus Acidoferrales bacterium]|nr:DUF6265 family protein [Candidatus Acidoferrales bacterium]
MGRIGLTILMLLAAVASLPPLDRQASLAGQQPAGIGGQPIAPPILGTVKTTGVSEIGEAPPSTPKSPLLNLSWLAGNWQGQWGQRLAEQDWMSPKAGLMVGTFRLVDNRKTLVLELFTMQEKPGGIELRLSHFTPELLPWTNSDPTLLNLKSADHNKVVFENPGKGDPKRVIFRRLDSDTFVLRSEIAPPNGIMQVTEITYRRLKRASPAAKAHRWFGFGNAEEQQ